MLQALFISMAGIQAVEGTGGGWVLNHVRCWVWFVQMSV